MKRAKLRGLKRNAAIVVGNVGTMEDVPVLRHALDDPEPLVREHAAWALGRVGPQTLVQRARMIILLPFRFARGMVNCSRHGLLVPLRVASKIPRPVSTKRDRR